jgi:iron(III) transport system permease protein
VASLTLTSDRAGPAWLGLLALSLAALPWYKGPLMAGPAASAVFEALSGRGWFWPLIAAARRSGRWR